MINDVGAKYGYNWILFKKALVQTMSNSFGVPNKNMSDIQKDYVRSKI